MCPNYPDKVDLGICGCHLADIDLDGDLILDCNDAPPNDPIKNGDINNDGDLDLANALPALQISTGVELPSELYEEADVNGDGRIGVERLLYILGLVSGFREEP